jgi:arylsulfatase A-like enzyme
MSDQHAYRALGAYGSRDVRTPALDRLARTGVRFDRAYTPSPVCVPARFALLTGRYPHTTGCVGNDTPLPLRERTVAHWLRDRGYLTAFVGKLHPVAPHTGGFDYYVDFGHYYDFLGPRVERFARAMGARNSGCGVPWIDRLHRTGAGAAGASSPWGAPPPGRPTGDALPLEDHFDRFVAHEAIRFLHDHAEEPFVLVVSFLAPHAPFAPPPEFATYRPAELSLPVTATARPPASPAVSPGNLDPHGGWFLPPPGDPRRDGEAREWLAAYYGNVSHLDAAAGRVLDALADLGLAEDTLVVYTSDHGELAYEHGLFGKGLFYEGSVRVPLIVRCPGVTRPGTATTDLTDLTDVLPTTLELTGLREATGLDGHSLVPTLASAGGPATPGAAGRPFAFSEIGFPHRPRYMLRSERWKYNHYTDPPACELFDLQDDPQETRNLADDPRAAAARARLSARLLEWLPAHLPR